MKPNHFFYLCLVLLLLPCMVACDDDDEEGSLSKTELLTSRTWKGNAVFAGGVNITTNEQLLSTMPDVRTLTLKFNSNGTYTADYIENDVPMTTEGQWEFRNNETTLYFDLMAAYDLKIGELDQKHLMLTTTVTYESITAPAEVHFTAQP